MQNISLNATASQGVRGDITDIGQIKFHHLPPTLFLTIYF